MFGRLDVLVTAAAVWERKPLEEFTAADVRRQFEINTLGTLLCCRRGGLIMAGQPEGGAIVTIGDWAVARPYPDYAAYFASKGAIPGRHGQPGRGVGPAEPGGPRQLHPTRPGDAARKPAGARGQRHGGRHLAQTSRPPGQRRPSGNFPGREQLRHRHLSAGQRRSNDRRRTVGIWSNSRPTMKRSEMFDSMLTAAQRRTIAKLRSPARIQAFLDELAYNPRQRRIPLPGQRVAGEEGPLLRRGPCSRRPCCGESAFRRCC